MITLRIQHVLTPQGFGPASVQVDDKGLITAVEAISAGPWDGWIALPGMVNAHSHSFQRVMCGYAEAAVGEQSFWGWRELMYRVAQGITPRDQFVIARQAFREMLAGGFTTVAEFHYLHHGLDGSRGTDMTLAVAEAAEETGIRLALLPVFYQRGGFGIAADPMQHRFVHQSVDEFLQLLELMHHRLGAAVAGIAPHSLRAVDPQCLPALVAGAREIIGKNCVVHMHVAEQTAEVEQSKTATGLTPVELLFEHCQPDELWSLVHATHISDAELKLMTNAGVNVVLCPLTEANLGDGIFPINDFWAGGGRIAIGTDSNARIDAVSELRLMEYGQRLTQQRRAVLADQHGLGARVWAHTARAGAGVLALNTGRIEVGSYADLLVLGEQSPLTGLPPMRAMDALITGGDGRNIADVYVGGRMIARDEPDEEFPDTARRLCAVH